MEHPKAKFKEIEEAVDRSLSKARARLLQGVALSSDAKKVSGGPDGSGARCSRCGHLLESGGDRTRRLNTNFDQPVDLKRGYGMCPVCKTGGSPLDEELGLPPGSLTPSLVEGVVQLGIRLPFGQAAELTGRFWKVDVSEATVRRTTEKSGQAYVELQREEAEELETGMAEAPEGPALQQLSVDGAMVPLLHGEWAEVKTLAIGTIEESDLEGEVGAREMSYFSRTAGHQNFARLATVETHRRGTENAREVCAVVDGAEWQQGFIDLHRPDAVRILDWRHAAEYLARAGQAAFGAGTAEASEWLGVQLHQLKHGEPKVVLRSLRDLCRKMEPSGASGDDGAVKTIKGSLEYLEKPRGQIRYAEFRAKGRPIGSGAVESANKLVVEARLKGSGMHWAREHVNPMVALRTVVCSGRWQEVWPEINQRLREQAPMVSKKHRPEKDPKNLSSQRGESNGESSIAPHESAVGSTNEPSSPPRPLNRATGLKAKPARNSKSPANRPRRPAPDHPWRRMTVGRNPSPTPTPRLSAKF